MYIIFIINFISIISAVSKLYNASTFYGHRGLQFIINNLKCIAYFFKINSLLMIIICPVFHGIHIRNRDYIWSNKVWKLLNYYVVFCTLYNLIGISNNHIILLYNKLYVINKWKFIIIDKYMKNISFEVKNFFVSELCYAYIQFDCWILSLSYVLLRFDYQIKL